MSRLLSKLPLSWAVGSNMMRQTPFVLNEHQLSRHMAVFGGSGSGKSKFLELLCRKMLDDYRGFCFIDPHGDTVEDLLAYAEKRRGDLRTDAVCKRIHYLEPTFETVFGFDPFEFRGGADIPEHLRDEAYHAWLHAKADRVATIVQRKQGQSDFQGMARLQRILRDVLIAVGTPITSDGKHLPLSDVLVLLDSHHPRHADVMKLVLDLLPSEVRADFASLASYRSEEQRKKETESTINRLRSLLSPIVKAIFSSAAATINFAEIIKNRGIVLVNLRKTDFFSADQRNAIGGLLIHEIISTAETTARHDRTPYYLIVDEARLFVGEDMMEALDQARKFKLSVILAGQYLGQFTTEEFDMTESILENCDTVVCFRQKHPKNLETWKQFFGYTNLDFTKLFQVMDRPDGYDVVTLNSTSRGTNQQSGSSVGGTIGGGTTRNSQDSTQHGTSRGGSTTESQSRSSQNGISEAEGSNSGTSESVTYRPIMRNGVVVGHQSAQVTGESGGQSSTSSRSSTEGSAVGKAETDSWQHSMQRGHAEGRSSQDNWGLNFGLNVGTGKNESESESETLRARYREEFRETGSLLNSADDQFHQVAAALRQLPDRFAIVGMRNLPWFAMKVSDVDPVFADSAETLQRLFAMKQKIFSVHPYYLTPSLSPQEQDRRLDEFLRAAVGAPDDDDGQEGAEKNSAFVS